MSSLVLLPLQIQWHAEDNTQYKISQTTHSICWDFKWFVKLQLPQTSQMTLNTVPQPPLHLQLLSAPALCYQHLISIMYLCHTHWSLYSTWCLYPCRQSPSLPRPPSCHSEGCLFWMVSVGSGPSMTTLEKLPWPGFASPALYLFSPTSQRLFHGIASSALFLSCLWDPLSPNLSSFCSGLHIYTSNPVPSSPPAL